jgi:hypothetical protein
VLRRPSVSPSIRHKEGYSRTSLSVAYVARGDGLEQPRQSWFRTPRATYATGEFSEPSVSQVEW